MKTLTAVDAILRFAENKDNTGCETRESKTQIRPEYNGIGRVWNDGQGFLMLADFHKNGTLVINELLLSKKEKAEIVSKLTVPFVLVKYGYPYYYNNSLTSLL